jgi:hypothetical protein
VIRVTKSLGQARSSSIFTKSFAVGEGRKGVLPLITETNNITMNQSIETNNITTNLSTRSKNANGTHKPVLPSIMETNNIGMNVSLETNNNATNLSTRLKKATVTHKLRHHKRRVTFTRPHIIPGDDCSKEGKKKCWLSVRKE